MSIESKARGTQVIEVLRCLTAISERKVYHFVFGIWFRDDGNQYPLYSPEDMKVARDQKMNVANPCERVVVKWEAALGHQNIPIPLDQVLASVFIQHRCVRSCVVSANHENCTCHSQCRTKPVCKNHPRTFCLLPSCKLEKAIAWIDEHNPAIKEYTVTDENWGFQAVM